MASEDGFAGSGERRGCVGPHLVEDLKDCFWRVTDLDEEVGKPVAGTGLRLLVDSIDFEEGDDHVWRERCFGALESLCHVADLGDDCFVWGLFGAWFRGDLVDLVKK